MADHKQPNNDDNETVVASRPMTEDQPGESGGGAYPNQRDDAYPDAHDFKGGQSDQAYYGGDQLGDEQLADNENAPSTQH